MKWKNIFLLFYIVLGILFLNSLYPLFEILKIVIFASIPLLVLTWIILIFIRNQKILRILSYISIGYFFYVVFVYIGFQFHNYSYIRKYQAEKTIELLQNYKKIHGIYPPNLSYLPGGYIPFTEPTYRTDSLRQSYYLFYDVGIFEDATFSSKQNTWYYGD